MVADGATPHTLLNGSNKRNAYHRSLDHRIIIIQLMDKLKSWTNSKKKLPKASCQN
ncbi:hypothetical protein PCCS19_01570 [Paenibacillus sp. CCS19]|nr:hypothetical protein PCCS19_01570 [Paenibacillus cellulosilyticus]